jgi:hypothetical protein
MTIADDDTTPAAPPPTLVFTWGEDERVGDILIVREPDHTVYVDCSPDDRVAQVLAAAGLLPAVPARKVGAGVTVEEADRAMRAAITAKPDRAGWSAREWARHVGCSHNTILKTPAWGEMEAKRLARELERARRRRP